MCRSFAVLVVPAACSSDRATPGCVRLVRARKSGHYALVTKPTAEAQLAEIERLLDEGVGRENVEDLTIAQRVQDVIMGFNGWTDLAIKRLHEIHRLQGQECEFCSKWIDGIS